MHRRYYRESKQYVEGSNAWAQGCFQDDNPYNPASQPLFWVRWDTGFLETKRLASDQYSIEDDY